MVVTFLRTSSQAQPAISTREMLLNPTDEFPTDRDLVRRLELLEDYDILDTLNEPEFDDIVMIASAVCKTPVALVSLVAEKRQWFKARVGFEACETPIERSVCRNALGSDAILVIPDLTADPRTSTNTLVTRPPHIRFYAGAPLVAPDGTVVGTLCVIDTRIRPQGLDAQQSAILMALARQVVTHLEARRISSRKDELFKRQRGLSATIRSVVNTTLAAQEAGRIGTFDIDIASSTVNASAQMCRIFGLPARSTYPARVFEELTFPEDRDRVSSDSSRTDASAPTNVIYRIRTPDGDMRWVSRNAVFELQEGVPTRMIGTVQDVTDERKAALRMEAMLELGDSLRDLEDVQSMVAVASNLMAKTLDAVRAGFGIVDPVAETVSIHEEWCAPGVRSIAGLHRFRDYGSYIDDLKEGRTVVILDVEADPRSEPHSDALLALGIRCLVNLPVMDRGKLELVVLVQHSKPYAWTDEELSFIRSFGDRVQLAISRRQAERDQEFLNREIGHRLKNTFAMVQAIAQQTLRRVSERDIVSDFTRRLTALSTAHDILLDSEHEGATVREVVDSFARTMTIADRVDVSGPTVTLGSRGTLSLSLLLHELGTNAMKYGSLSNDGGRIAVTWDTSGEGEDTAFRLRWRESGGPAAAEPGRKGFGSKLISMGLIGTGGVTTHYGEEGFSAEMSANLIQMERAN